MLISELTVLHVWNTVVSDDDISLYSSVERHSQNTTAFPAPSTTSKRASNSGPVNVVAPPAANTGRKKPKTPVMVKWDESTCDICEITFANSEAHARHHSAKHSLLHALRFECPVCNRSFSTKSNLNRHSKSEHVAPKKNHTCEACGMSFGCPANLRRHKRTHEDARHKCPVCDQSFTRTDAVKRHCREQHEFGKELACTICHQQFTRLSNMVSHKHWGGTDGTYGLAYACSSMQGRSQNLFIGILYFNTNSTHPDECEVSDIFRFWLKSCFAIYILF